MKYLLMVFILCISALASAQNTQSPEQIRQQMTKIRQTTNWDDPVAAKKANEEIKKLAKQLMMGAGQQSRQGAGSGSGSGKQDATNSSNDAEDLAKINEEMVNQKMDIYSQIWEAAAGGEGADILLAEPLRDEIVEEFKEDDNITLSPEVAEKIDVLVLDMSMPGIDAVIDAMSSFRSITTLAILGGKNKAQVDLAMIFKQAEDYPLTDLYILGFGNSVTALPSSISQFKNLKTLSLSGNRIESLPQEIAALNQITDLYLNNNPIEALFPFISQLKNLKTLCLYFTSVPGDEVAKIQQFFPECKILVK